MFYFNFLQGEGWSYLSRYLVLRCLRSSHTEVAAFFILFFFIFSYLSFAVHLPLLHEYRTIFRLTFSSAWRNRRWWKFMESWNLSKNNSSVGAALGSAPSRKKSPHRTRPLPLTASAVSKCNWNIMCQTGYHSRHYAALNGALRWPFRQRMQRATDQACTDQAAVFFFLGVGYVFHSHIEASSVFNL